MTFWEILNLLIRSFFIKPFPSKTLENLSSLVSSPPIPNGDFSQLLPKRPTIPPNSATSLGLSVQAYRWGWAPNPNHYTHLSFHVGFEPSVDPKCLFLLGEPKFFPIHCFLFSPIACQLAQQPLIQVSWSCQDKEYCFITPCLCVWSFFYIEYSGLSSGGSPDCDGF